MFYLESFWEQTWNRLQGFEGWWSPLFFQTQKNKPFNSKHYLHRPSHEARVEWTVLNFVSRDYCKCLVGPEFLTPKFGLIDKYQQEYVKKRCYEE